MSDNLIKSNTESRRDRNKCIDLEETLNNAIDQIDFETCRLSTKFSSSVFADILTENNLLTRSQTLHLKQCRHCNKYFDDIITIHSTACGTVPEEVPYELTEDIMSKIRQIEAADNFRTNHIIKDSIDTENKVHNSFRLYISTAVLLIWPLVLVLTGLYTCNTTSSISFRIGELSPEEYGEQLLQLPSKLKLLPEEIYSQSASLKIEPKLVYSDLSRMAVSTRTQIEQLVNHIPAHLGIIIVLLTLTINLYLIAASRGSIKNKERTKFNVFC